MILIANNITFKKYRPKLSRYADFSCWEITYSLGEDVNLSLRPLCQYLLIVLYSVIEAYASRNEVPKFMILHG